jgi:peptide/nickel transport system permease protein
LNVGAYVVRRALLSVVVILGTITLTFFISHAVPGNPAVLFAGQNPTPDQIAKITKEYGFDTPLYNQFFIYVTQLFSGNLGSAYSLAFTPVSDLIFKALPNTFTLAALATAFAALIGIPLGVEAAKRSGKWIDSVLRIFSVGFVATPTFWLGLMFQIVFAASLGLLPLAAYGGSLLYTDLHPIRTITGSYLVDSLLSGNTQGFLAIFWSMILPVVTLALYPIGVLTRQTRASMQANLSQDYIRTARAYGIPESKINYSLALRNTLPLVIVILGLNFAGSIIGVVFVEDVYALFPGIGHLICQAAGTCISSTGIGSLDYPLITGLTLVVAVIYVGVNFVVDMVHIYFDRRLIR